MMYQRSPEDLLASDKPILVPRNPDRSVAASSLRFLLSYADTRLKRGLTVPLSRYTEGHGIFGRQDSATAVLISEERMPSRVGIVAFRDRSALVFVADQMLPSSFPPYSVRITVLPEVFRLASIIRVRSEAREYNPRISPSYGVSIRNPDRHHRLQLALHPAQDRENWINIIQCWRCPEGSGPSLIRRQILREATAIAAAAENGPVLHKPANGEPFQGSLRSGAEYFWPEFFPHCLASDADLAELKRLVRATATILLYRHAKDGVTNLGLTVSSGVFLGEPKDRLPMVVADPWCDGPAPIALRDELSQAAWKMIFANGVFEKEKAMSQRFLSPTHDEFTPRRQQLAGARVEGVPSAHEVLQQKSLLGLV